MGFGTGLGRPKQARHRPALNFDGTRSIPTGMISLAQARIVTPSGTPWPVNARVPFGDPRAELDVDDPLSTTEAPRLARARALLGSAVQELGPRRTLISDARDLFAHVLFQHTGAPVRLGRELVETPRSIPVRDRWPGLHPFNDPVLVRIGWSIGTHRALSQIDVAADLTAGLLASAIPPRLTHQGFESRDDLLQAIDGDGFLALALTVDGRVEVILLGGSDYGTYFAVVWFLERFLGASWVLPGPGGEVLPPPPAGLLVRAADINHLEEPDFRGRSIAMSGQNMPPIDLDDLRDWQLRNRLRPTNDRLQIAQSLLGVFQCSSTSSSGPPGSIANGDAPHLVAHETRFPADHALHRWLSPLRPSTRVSNFGQIAAPPADAPARGLASAGVYPDLRKRFPVAADAPYALEPAAPRNPVDAIFGGRVEAAEVTRRMDNGVLAPDDCRVPFPDQFRLERVRAHLNRELAGSRALEQSATLVNGGVRFDSRGVRDAAGREARRLTFYPFVRGSSFEGRLPAADIAWAPCVYDERQADALTARPNPASTSPELPIRVRAELVEEIVEPLGLALHLQSIAHGLDGGVSQEASLSLAFDDGIGNAFCQCNGCVYGQNFTAATGAWMYRGAVVEYAGRPLSQSSFLIPTSIAADALTLRGVAVLPAAAGDLPGDALTRVPRFSRYTVDLTRAVATALERWFFPVSSDWAVIVVHAYSSYNAAPLFGPDPSGAALRLPTYADGAAPYGPLTAWDRANAVHPMVLVYVAETRDEPEYGDVLYEGSTPTPQVVYDEAVRRGTRPYPLQRQYPAQFSLHRWSMVAARLGFYEYMYGSGYLMPRVYSRRLHEALRVGLKLGVCAFFAECSPAFGMAGPSYWEAARMLWDNAEPAPGTPPPRVRWAAAMVRRAGDASARPDGTDALVAVWDDLERLWSARRTKRTSVNTADINAGLQFTFPYRGSILVFEPLDPAPDDPALAIGPTLRRSLQGLALLESSLQTPVPGSLGFFLPTAASRRVGGLRAALAIATWMEEVAGPIVALHRRIRGLLAPPADLKDLQGRDIVQQTRPAAAEITSVHLLRNFAVVGSGMNVSYDPVDPSNYAVPMDPGNAVTIALAARRMLAGEIATLFVALPAGMLGWFRSGEGFRTGVRLAFHALLAQQLRGFVTLTGTHRARLGLSGVVTIREDGVEVPLVYRHALWYGDLGGYIGQFWDPMLVLRVPEADRAPDRLQAALSEVDPTVIGAWSAYVDETSSVGFGGFFQQLKQMVLDIDSFLRMVYPDGDVALVNAPFGRGGASLPSDLATFARS